MTTVHVDPVGEEHPKIFYRFHKENKWNLDESEEVMQYDTAIVRMEEYRLERATPKGYWIRPLHWSQYAPHRVWVSATARKRHAYPTKEAAFESFLVRSKHRKNHLVAQLRQIEDAMRYATENKSKLLQST